MVNEQNDLRVLEQRLLARGEEKLRRAIVDPTVQEVIRRRVSEIVNEIISRNSEWKQIRKNEKGDSIGHRFTDNTNWVVSVDPQHLHVKCRNITPPSRSIFFSKKFGYEDKYNYDRSKDPYDGAALAVWIDRGLWIDVQKLFEEMARANGAGKINADQESIRRSAIPFFDETRRRIANDIEVKQAVVNATKKIK